MLMLPPKKTYNAVSSILKIKENNWSLSVGSTVESTSLRAAIDHKWINGTDEF